MSALGQSLLDLLQAVRTALAEGDLSRAAECMSRAQSLTDAAAREPVELSAGELETLLSEHAAGALATQEALTKLVERSEERSTFNRAERAYQRRSGSR